MNINKEEIKRKALNYRSSLEEGKNCASCTHPKKMNCVVIDGRVHFDAVCDAWNDKALENTWYLCLYAVREKLFVMVKEESRSIVDAEYDLPIKSADAKMMELFTTATLIHGCPDYVCNVSPRKFRPVAFKMWLKYRDINYVENEITFDEEPNILDELDVTPLELLSMMVDAALRPVEAGRPDNGK